MLVVGGMGCLDSVDIDDSKSMFGSEGKGGGLDATIAVGSTGGAIEGHDGGGVKVGDCGCKHCCIAMFAEKLSESRVHGVSSVNEMWVRLLDGEDVKILGGGKVEGTGGGVMEALVPCCCTKDGGRSGWNGGGRHMSIEG